MKYILVFCSIIFFQSIATESQSSEYLIKKRQTEVLTHMFDQLVERQIPSERSVELSVTALLKNYPEQIVPVLNIAISKYPNDYEQILCGALRAEPALTSDVIDLILQNNIASKEEVISFALREEPAYAPEIVNSAISYAPQDMENIIRVAIITEPVMANNIVNSMMQSYPERLLDILVIAIKTIPNQVVNIVKNTLRISPDNSEVVSMAISSSKDDKTRQIITAAIKSGFSEEAANTAAIIGGAKESNLVMLKP